LAARRKRLDIEKKNLWYLVGLVTSDGCLSSDGRHIDITSKNREFLQKIKDSLVIDNKIASKYNSKKQRSYRIQIANRELYDFLISIGLKPNKSLTLGVLTIPVQSFPDFLRGVIDGDGNIRRWLHTHNKGEQWSLRVYSGSLVFIKWLKDKIESLFKARGRLYCENYTTWVLKYGKIAARTILSQCYYKDALAMDRKARLAEKCITSHIGWAQSKTVFN